MWTSADAPCPAQGLHAWHAYVSFGLHQLQLGSITKTLGVLVACTMRYTHTLICVYAPFAVSPKGGHIAQLTIFHTWPYCTVVPFGHIAHLAILHSLNILHSGHIAQLAISLQLCRAVGNIAQLAILHSWPYKYAYGRFAKIVVFPLDATQVSYYLTFLLDIQNVHVTPLVGAMKVTAGWGCTWASAIWPSVQYGQLCNMVNCAIWSTAQYGHLCNMPPLQYVYLCNLTTCAI